MEESAFRSILRAALTAADPKEAVLHSLQRQGNLLKAGQRTYPLESFRHIYAISAGKAAVSMARAVVEVLGDKLTGGLVIAPRIGPDSLGPLRVVSAGHPIPDQNGLLAAEECLRLAEKAGQDDWVWVLLSGGASALLPAPVKGVTLKDKQRVTGMLLKSGAVIDEINIVRKHLSRIKGGGLAGKIHPASSLTLILSDVLGNDLSVIASGPTAPDPSTFNDALSVLKKCRLLNRVPQAVRRHLVMGARGRHPETPKAGDPIFRTVQHLIIGDNRRSVEAAVAQARALGFQTLILTTRLQGEAREIGRVFGAIAHEIHHFGRPFPRPACILAGGELTVTVKGPGLGGRAQEFALAAALSIAGLPKTAVIGFGTDGLDGPTESAGAVADGTTVERALKAGLDPAETLEQNNAYPFFKNLGDLILTGPTGTNVNDLYLLLMP
jgi:hydroxypyruvate reductase